MICPPIPPVSFTFCRAYSTPPRLLMSKGTSNPSSRGRGKLPGQAGASHSQTAVRGGQCSAGAGQENHQAASAAAATSGKEGNRQPHWQEVEDKFHISKTGMLPRSVCTLLHFTLCATAASCFGTNVFTLFVYCISTKLWENNHTKVGLLCKIRININRLQQIANLTKLYFIHSGTYISNV